MSSLIVLRVPLKDFWQRNKSPAVAAKVFCMVARLLLRQTEAIMAGTSRNRPLIAEGPAIVLVEPQLGENIGMVARAMANFGLGDLRLVAPRDGWPNDQARASASGANHIIDAAQVFPTLGDALGDLNFVYATTARERDDFKPVRGPTEACAALRLRHRGGEKTGILFGRERFGLSNDEISFADEIVTFPVNPAFASLNIAQAVLLVAYEWMKSGLQEGAELPFDGARLVPATRQDLFGLFDHLEEALGSRGYFRPPAKKQRLVENLRSVLTRAGFAKEEIRVLRGVISSLDRFTRKAPRGSQEAGQRLAGKRPGQRQAVDKNK